MHLAESVGLHAAARTAAVVPRVPSWDSLTGAL